MPTTSWVQRTVTLPAAARGCYLITEHVEAALPELREFRVGVLHLFVPHTSCALALNEDWDPDVRRDMADALDRLAPEDDGAGGRRGGALYRHAAEGRDDMPVRNASAPPPPSLVSCLRGWGLLVSQTNLLTGTGAKNYQAHVKSALVGASVSIPISAGQLATGTWQGIWYLEFRAAQHTRKLVATIHGERED